MANWPAMRPTFTIGDAAGERQDHRHLQEHAEEVADVVGRMLAEALGAVAALQQEGLAGGDAARARASVSAPRRRRPAADSLRAGARPPRARRGPYRPAPARPALSASCRGSNVGSPFKTPWPLFRSGLLTGKRFLYKPTPNGDMPFFGGGSRLFQRSRSRSCWKFRSGARRGGHALSMYVDCRGESARRLI